MITLHDSNEVNFKTLGYGVVNDFIEGIVVEELNGGFELQLEYPINGIRYNDMLLGRILYCEPNPYDKPQPFRIYSISKPINRVVTINAAHISYDLSGYPVNEFVAKNAKDAMSALKSNSQISHAFSFNSTVTAEGEVTVKEPKSTRSVIGNNILSAYGGEFEFDTFMVYHVQNRGVDRGISIRYGKNLLDIKQEENIAEVSTALYPYWAGVEYNESDGTSKDIMVKLPERLLQVEGTFGFTRILPVNMSSELQEKPTEAQLREAGLKYIEKNKIGVPKVSIDIDFIQLTKSSEYAQYAMLEEVRLGDTLLVEFDEAKINATARCIKTSYNLGTKKYDAIELGDAKSNLATSISDSNKTINDKLEQQQIYFDAEIGSIKIDMAVIDTAIIGKANIDWVEANYAHITNGVIDNATIGDLTVTTAKIADAAITSAKIGDAQIGNAQIANGSIDNAKIEDATITGAKIQDASIGTAQIGDAQITVAKIQDAFIDNLVAAQGKFESAHIGELTSDNITAGAISADVIEAINMNVSGKISADRIDVSSLVVDEIDAGKITTGTLDADRIGALSITTEKLAAGAVTADKITSGSVTTDKLDAKSVTTDKLAAGSVTADKITAGAITTDKIGANQITASKIAANSITSDKIAAGTIVAEDISTDTLDAIAINAGSIVANDITTGVIKISNANILDGTISGAKITNASITNAQIANATIESAKIKNLDVSKLNAGTIDTSKINLASIDGTLNITNNLIQIKDAQSTPKVRVQIGKDALGGYGILVTNASGEAIFDSDYGVLSDKGLSDGVVSTDKIVDEAVSPGKIQIRELWAEEAYINEFNGQTINADNITTGTISGERINIKGLINFEALDDDLGKLFVPGSGNGTIINGGFIGADTIKANSIDLYSGITVRKEDGTPSFAIAENGEVEVNGLLKSANYIPGDTGYKISTDGTAELNQAVIRGTIELENAGMTNYGAPVGNENKLTGTSGFDKNYNTLQHFANISGTKPIADFGLKVGDTVTYRVYLKPTAGVTEGARARLSCYTNPADTTVYKTFSGNIIAMGEEGYSTVTFTVPADTYQMFFGINNTNASVTTGSQGTYNYPKVEIGSEATPWCPHPSEQTNYTRIWAGKSYAERDSAPFRVQQDGSLYALDGTFEGKLYGDYNNDYIHIHKDKIEINDRIVPLGESMEEYTTTTPFISLGTGSSVFNTNLSMGNGNIEYLLNSNTFNIKNTDFKVESSIGTVLINKDGGVFGGLNILGPSGGHHVFRGSTSKDKLGTLVFDSEGNQGTKGDFSFTRKNYTGESCKVDIDGGLTVKDRINSSTQNIEMRSVANEGWGFYAT